MIYYRKIVLCIFDKAICILWLLLLMKKLQIKKKKRILLLTYTSYDLVRAKRARSGCNNNL